VEPWTDIEEVPDVFKMRSLIGMMKIVGKLWKKLKDKQRLGEVETV